VAYVADYGRGQSGRGVAKHYLAAVLLMMPDFDANTPLQVRQHAA